MEDRKARLAALAARAGRTENIVGSSSAPLHEQTAPEPMVIVEENDMEMPPSKRSRSNHTEPSKKKEKTALEIALERAQAELIVGGATPSLLAENEATLSIPPPQQQEQYKINWDLKRDIQPSLDILDRRTQKAIVQLLRERLEREVQEEDNVD